MSKEILAKYNAGGRLTHAEHDLLKQYLDIRDWPEKMKERDKEKKATEWKEGQYSNEQLKKMAVSQGLIAEDTLFFKVEVRQDNDGHWYVIPAEKGEEFSQLLDKSNDRNLPEDEMYAAEEKFIEKFSEYMTGGDLNLTQLYMRVDPIEDEMAKDYPLDVPEPGQFEGPAPVHTIDEVMEKDFSSHYAAHQNAKTWREACDQAIKEGPKEQPDLGFRKFEFNALKEAVEFGLSAQLGASLPEIPGMPDSTNEGIIYSDLKVGEVTQNEDGGINVEIHATKITPVDVITATIEFKQPNDAYERQVTDEQPPVDHQYY